MHKPQHPVEPGRILGIVGKAEQIGEGDDHRQANQPERIDSPADCGRAAVSPRSPPSDRSSRAGWRIRSAGRKPVSFRRERTARRKEHQDQFGRSRDQHADPELRAADAALEAEEQIDHENGRLVPCFRSSLYVEI